MMICSAILTFLLIFGDSRCVTGYVKAEGKLQQQCQGLRVESDCVGGRGVFNPGFGETTSPRQQLAEALLSHPREQAVLIELDVNDWGYRRKTPEEVIDELEVMGDMVLAAGKTPIFTTGWPVGDASVGQSLSTASANRGAWVGEIRAKKLTQLREAGFLVIDTTDAFEIHNWSSCTSDGNKAPDNVHPFDGACRDQWAVYVAENLP